MVAIDKIYEIDIFFLKKTNVESCNFFDNLLKGKKIKLSIIIRELSNYYDCVIVGFLTYSVTFFERLQKYIDALAYF